MKRKASVEGTSPMKKRKASAPKNSPVPGKGQPSILAWAKPRPKADDTDSSPIKKVEETAAEKVSISLLLLTSQPKEVSPKTLPKPTQPVKSNNPKSKGSAMKVSKLT